MLLFINSLFIYFSPQLLISAILNISIVAILFSLKTISLILYKELTVFANPVYIARGENNNIMKPTIKGSKTIINAEKHVYDGRLHT